MIKKIMRYGINLCLMLIYNIRFYGNVKIGLIQNFEHLRIEINGKSNVRLGNFNQNRGCLYMGVNNGELEIGDHCFFNINCSITCMEHIKIGDYCKFGNNLVIVDHDHNFKTSDPEFISNQIIIGNNVWVGANVTILRGSVIGDNCVIAAGSIVKGTVPTNHIFFSKKNVELKLINNIRREI